MKTLRDPVHGDIQLSAEELSLIDTPEFQRLRGIRQLGTSYLVFPGAQHTRFEHSLGTCWLLKRLVREINQRKSKAGMPDLINGDQQRFLSIAALLHDITHIPFGHTFEDERRILPPHDKSRSRLSYFLKGGILGQRLKELGLQDSIHTFFSQKGDPNRPFLYDLVAGPICADLLDYLKRDAYFCGLKMDYDERIFKYLDVESRALCFDLYNDKGFRADAWSELIHLLRIRFQLTERVYFHHAKMVSGAMLSRILEAILARRLMVPEQLYSLNDNGFLHTIGQLMPSVSAYQPLYDAFLSRQLYKRVYMVAKDPLRPNYPDQDQMAHFQSAFHLNEEDARTKLERTLSRRLKIPISSIIIYAPDTRMQLKEACINVRIDSGPVMSLQDIHHRELDALRSGHRSLWRFFLFMSPKYSDRFIQASRIMEEEIGLPNQLELLEKGQLTLRFD